MIIRDYSDFHDMEICCYHASIFEMQIWHPTTEAAVDEFLGLGVQV